MRKLIGLTLALSSLSTFPVAARQIWLTTTTNNGQVLGFYTNADAVHKNGWTVFKYGISQQGTGIYRGNGLFKPYPIGNVTERIAVTTYCRGGSSTKVSLPIPSWATAGEEQQLNQLNRSLSQAVGQPGWLTIVNGNATFVRADSEGSKNLLQSICQYDGK